MNIYRLNRFQTVSVYLKNEVTLKFIRYQSTPQITISNHLNKYPTSGVFHGQLLNIHFQSVHFPCLVLCFIVIFYVSK